MLWTEPGRLVRMACFSRYISPVAEWDPKFFSSAKTNGDNGDESAAADAAAAQKMDAGFGAVKWRGLKFM